MGILFVVVAYIIARMASEDNGWTVVLVTENVTVLTHFLASLVSKHALEFNLGE